MNNTNNALETLVQRDKQIKKTNDKLKASINELNAELESTTNALSTHASNTDIHTSKEELIQLIVDHLESLDLGITKEVVSVLPTENISDNTLYFVPNEKGFHNEYLYINDKWELVGSTETNFTDYYTKLETNTLLEGKANSKHNHVTSDITDFPTIPTKLSQLENDMGFGSGSGGVITSISWTNITDKPNFATVATSGSYTDLSNTPTIPTKVSQLENDTGFVNALTDVVDTKSNQTINGTKTFTNGPWVINSQTTMGYSIKNTALARNEIPTEYQHYTFRAYDKNSKTMGEYCIEKATTGDALLNMNVRSEDASGTQISYGMQFRMTNDGSLVRFMPSANNKVHLGDVGAKWASVHATNAHINNTYTNRVTSYSITHPSGDNNSYFFMSGGSDYDKGATLYLGGVSATNFTPGRFALAARKTDGSSVELAGSPNGTLTWGGKSLAIDDNVVHKTGDETINGIKTFTQGINIQKSDIDLTITPTSNKYSTYLFTDKNNKSLGVVQYAQRATDVNDLDLYVFDKNSTAHGIQITTNNELSPIGNNYSLGSSSAKWGNVYANTFNGNLKGNADTATSATKSSYLDNYSLPGGNKIYLDWSGQKKGYVGLKVDNTVMGGLITTNNIGSQAANSATYSTTPATTDNSTRIATTAWVRTYVNSVVGSNTVGSSVSAYWSNSSNVTATKQTSATNGYYPSGYSEYITKTPTVGTIYSGAQLYTSLDAYANATGTVQSSGQYHTHITSVTAQATFSNPISSTGKYLCTTANTVRFRGYAPGGNSVGTASVVENSSTKSIFIRVE